MAKIPRSEVVQGVLNLFPDPAYLEVGVSKGVTFDAVKARRKVAVDPAFQFDVTAARMENPNSEYHPVTSDHFFGSIISDDDTFDVIYLDGMHTLEQTLRDFINAVHFLKKGGAIVIDDVYPNSYVASISSITDFRKLKKALSIQAKAWMGDVYRLVYFIDSFFQQMTFRTVQDNHGQLVVWEQRRRETSERTVEAVGRLPYEQMVLTKGAMRFAPFSDILAEIRKSRESSIAPSSDPGPAIDYVTCEEYFSSRPGLTLLRNGHSYTRKSPRFVNAELTTPLIAKRYKDQNGRTPDEGVAVFQNATVFGPGIVMTSDGAIVDESVESPRFAPGGKPPEAPKLTFEEAVSFCKVGVSNYGHFLVEMLPRLLLNTGSLPPHARILLHGKAKGFGPAMMQAAGIDSRRIHVVSDAPVRVRKLHWPTRNSFHPFNTSPHAIAALRDLGDRLVPTPPRADRRIFLSRRDATRRQLINDAEVFGKLEPFGFEWIEPGKMTFVEQIRTFKSSSKVVAVCGAALTNMVFLPPASEVVMLTPQTAAGFWFWDLAHHVGADFTVIFGRNEDPSIPDKNADFRIRPEDVPSGS